MKIVMQIILIWLLIKWSKIYIMKQDNDILTKIQKVLNYDIKVFSSTFSDKDKERFFSEIGLLLSEGIHLKNAIELLTNDDEKKNVLQVLNELKKRVTNGEKFSDAMHALSQFSDYDYQNISIAEESGKLPFVMGELGKYYAQKLKLKRLILSALSYPILVLSIAFLAIIFLLNFIVPMFSEIFQRFNGDLPYITRLIISLSGFIRQYFIVMLILIIVNVVILYHFRKSDWLKKYYTLILLKLPIIGNLIHNIYLARFCNTLGLLISARVSIVKSLELCENIVDFYPIDITMNPIKQSVVSGNTLHSAMAVFPIYPKKAVALIKVGEEINKTDEMLLKAGKKYAEDAEYQLEILNKIIEPILIVFLGFIVAIILLAMYLPLFQLGTQIG